MLVKVIEKYKDKEIGDIVPAGVILEVNEARADILKLNGKAEDYIVVPAPKPEKKSKKEPEVDIQPEVSAVKEAIEESVTEESVTEKAVEEPAVKSEQDSEAKD